MKFATQALIRASSDLSWTLSVKQHHKSGRYL
jgi:hypothetical protein